jgi:hypothetical protein
MHQAPQLYATDRGASFGRRRRQLALSVHNLELMRQAAPGDAPGAGAELDAAAQAQRHEQQLSLLYEATLLRLERGKDEDDRGNWAEALPLLQEAVAGLRELLQLETDESRRSLLVLRLREYEARCHEISLGVHIEPQRRRSGSDPTADRLRRLSGASSCSDGGAEGSDFAIDAPPPETRERTNTQTYI